MGLCINQLYDIQIKNQKSSNRQSMLMEKYLLNSFSFDPKYMNKAGFFYIDLPGYCQIQYILRTKHNEQQDESILQNIKKHIQEIEIEINKLNQVQTDDSVKHQIDEEQKIREIKNYKVLYYDTDCNSYCLSQNQLARNCNNTLNFQLVSANLHQCQNMDKSIEIFLNNKKVISMMGQVYDKKWNPSEQNQISIINCQIDIKNEINESRLKIAMSIRNKLIQCTIPLNQMTFKHMLPVLQTCILRSKQDNQPLGHIHFKIQYIGQFQKYRQKIITNLKTRRDGLVELYKKMGKKQGEELSDNQSIVIKYDEFGNSFASSNC